MIRIPPSRSRMEVGLLAVFTLVMLVTPLAAADLTFTLELPVADVRLEHSGDATSVHVAAPGYYSLTDEGLPALPYRTVNVVLPPGEAVDGFEVTDLRELELSASFTPVVAGPALTVEGERARPAPLAPADGGVFPARRVRYVGTGVLHGRSIATFLVFPLRTDDGRLLLSERLDLHVATRPASAPDAVTRLRYREGFEDRIARELASFAINPEAAARYPVAPSATPAATGGGGGFQPTSYPSLEGSPVDYLIITADSLASSYQPLADWKTAKGVPAVIRTVEWIQANTRHGSDLQETIRNFVIDAYAKWGITYVLLGGDTDVIPARLGRSTILGDKKLPADMYYACLDGDWNKDHDQYFGEGGPMADAPDLYAEVYIGRLPGSTIDAAGTLVQKVLDYETPVDPSYTDKMMLLAEVLFPIDWSYGDTIQQDGAELSEFVYLSSFNDPSLRVSRLYQNYWDYPEAEKETVAGVIDSLEAGYNIVNHIGHGFRFNMSVGDGSVTNQHADELFHPGRYTNFYLLNCTAVAYTFFCLGEHLLLNPDGGGVSVIGANESALPLTSQPYMNEYFNLVMNRDVVHIGEAFARSRLPRTGTAQSGDTIDLWTHYIYTILADPEMSLWTGVVEPMTVSHPAAAQQGPNSITVNVTDSGGPVDSAVVCLSKGADDYAVAATDAAGQVTFDFTPESPGSISVVVTAYNRASYQGSIEVSPYGPPYVSFVDASVNDDATATTSGNGDGVIDAGETVELLPEVENTGGADADDVSLVLRSLSGVAVVEDSVASAGVVLSGESRAAADPFRVAFSPTIGDEEVVEFQLVVKNNGVEIGTDNFRREVHAPKLEIVVLRVDDSAQGNGDGVNQDNETFDLFVQVKNFGTGSATGLAASIADVSGAFVFEDSADVFPDCGPNVSVENGGGFTMREPDTSAPHDIEIDILDAYGRSVSRVFELRPPDPPQSVSFDPSLAPDRLKLTWDPSASADAAGYRVYRSGAPGGPYQLVSLDPVDHTVFVDYPLQPTTAYHYVVSTIDASGNESALSPEFTGSTNPDQVEGWPIAMTLESTSSPVVGDIDGDQDFEVVVGNEKVYAWHHDGVEMTDADGNAQTWGLLSTAGNDFVSHIALAEVDAVAGNDIIAASRDTREIYVFNYQGNVLPGWPQPVENPIRAGLVASDIDGNDVKEIIAVDEKGVVYVWNPDGTEWRDGDSDPATHGVFKRTSGNIYLYATPAAADLDNDGVNEIILGTQGGMVYAWNEDGSSVPGWPQSFGTAISGAIAVGDIDGDGGGDLELVVCEQGGMNTALHHDGTYLWQVWLPNNQSFGPSPALGDLDGDGDLETVIPSSNLNLYVIKPNGGLLSGWPVQYAASLYTESSPLIADIDRDGSLDVLLGDETRYINAWDAGGNLLAGFPLATDDAVRATPTIADLDKDGDVDLVGVTWAKKVYVWDFPDMFDPHKSPWASYHANLYNDGNITTKLPTGIHNVAFAFEVSGGSLDLEWMMPAEAGYLFDVFRASADRASESREHGPFERVASNIGIDGGGRLHYVDTRVEPGVTYVYRITGSGGEEIHQTPSVYVPVTRSELSQNYPNPFNPTTRIVYRVPDGPGRFVQLSVYDVRGARVRTLVSGEVAGGRHEVLWDGRDDRGARVGSGVYFYRLRSGDYQATRKMLLLK